MSKHGNGCWRKQRAKRCRWLGARLSLIERVTADFAPRSGLVLRGRSARDAIWYAKAGRCITSKIPEAVSLIPGSFSMRRRQ